MSRRGLFRLLLAALFRKRWTPPHLKACFPSTLHRGLFNPAQDVAGQYRAGALKLLTTYTFDPVMSRFDVIYRLEEPVGEARRKLAA